MNELLVWGSAIGFMFVIFPIHIFNYVYVNTQEKYASINVSAYRLIRLANVNTIKNKPDKMMINGKEKKMNLSFVKSKSLKIFNNLCLTKVIQLSDFGLMNEYSATAALVQNSLTKALYFFIKENGGKTKLKNYIVLNYNHGSVNYYLKLVGIINLLTVGKIILMLIMEKLKDVKNQS